MSVTWQHEHAARATTSPIPAMLHVLLYGCEAPDKFRQGENQAEWQGHQHDKELLCSSIEA